MIDQTQMTKDLVDVVNRHAGPKGENINQVIQCMTIIMGTAMSKQDWCRWSIDIDPPTPRDRLVAD